MTVSEANLIPPWSCGPVQPTESDLAGPQIQVLLPYPIISSPVQSRSTHRDLDALAVRTQLQILARVSRAK